jgi:23S rRNA (uridine2552-2'-O)-methyltransferase
VVFLSKAWLQARKRDYYHRKAKEENFRSRAAYKLLQAVQKYKFIKKGDMVIDLGAAPGGWLQIAGKIVGSDGFVLGIDLKPITPFSTTNIQTFIGDVNDGATLKKVLLTLSRKADVVISDMSPNISGIWEVDHARQIDLAGRALEIALQTLKTHGSFFVKVFQGDLLPNFVEKVKEAFNVVKLIKPKASRMRSSEIFVFGSHLMKGTYASSNELFPQIKIDR